MTDIKLYCADCTGVAGNTSYPHAAIIRDAGSLRAAVAHDYVAARFRGSYRSLANFIEANCLCKDCDNDHSDEPDDWVTPEHVRSAFPDVPLAIHYSRNHMRPKRGKAPRPKFHCILLTDNITSADEYKQLAKRAHDVFPFFDTRAEDAAHFFFGTPDAQVEFYPGTCTLNECLAQCYPDEDLHDDGGTEARGDATDVPRDAIPEGQRNSTLSRYAARVLKRYGDSEQARERFQARAACCQPPLPETELATIWRSAQGFYQRISRLPGYVPPEQWRAAHSGETGNNASNGNVKFKYDPTDRTDVGQARLLGKFFKRELRYSPATDYLRYDGSCWQETQPGAQAIAHALTDRQLKEAEAAITQATQHMIETGAQGLVETFGRAKAESKMNAEQREAYTELQQAESYRNYALKRRESKNITSTLREAHPVLEIEPGMLDRDWFLLCTPEATYDLRKGLSGARPHSPDDFITKMTSYSPGKKGWAIWQEALNTFFCADTALIEYVQRVAGLVCLGQVFLEAMIIAYGDGRNGKSTFWNTLSRVLGSYSGNISADSLTMSCKRNVKPELAETKGKRLLIAAELEEGTRLNNSIVKQLCSTDAVFAEKKYKDPFSFIPSHTLVLYTNHLPKVGAKDTGIWRRLIVIPFKAKIEGSADIKNYTEYLCENAGPAIMKWMIDGARQVIELGFNVPFPQCVSDAISAYKADNDWLGHFLEECCEIGEGLETRSGELYNRYRTYSIETGEYVRGTADFYAALEAEGFVRGRTGRGTVIRGVRLLQTEFEPVDDFLS